MRPSSVETCTKAKSQSDSVSYFVSKVSVRLPAAGTVTGRTIERSMSSAAPAARTASPACSTDCHSSGAGACFAGPENSSERTSLAASGLPAASRRRT